MAHNGRLRVNTIHPESIVPGEVRQLCPSSFLIGLASFTNPVPHSQDSRLDLHWTNRYIWNNIGDAAMLVDADGKMVCFVEEGKQYFSWPREVRTPTALAWTGAWVDPHPRFCQQSNC